jgi:hypothetical protein
MPRNVHIFAQFRAVFNAFRAESVRELEILAAGSEPREGAHMDPIS